MLGAVIAATIDKLEKMPVSSVKMLSSLKTVGSAKIVHLFHSAKLIPPQGMWGFNIRLMMLQYLIAPMRNGGDRHRNDSQDHGEAEHSPGPRKSACGVCLMQSHFLDQG